LPPTAPLPAISLRSLQHCFPSDSNGDVDGDDNRNARVAVSYRKKGETAWKDGLPLLRIGNERINENALQYIVPERICRQHLRAEPGHGVRMPFRSVGSRWRRRQDGEHRHRPHALRAEAGDRRRGLSCLSTGYNGQRQQPAFNGLLAAYFTGSSHSDNFNTFPPRVKPGDVILVHAGLYKDDRYRYGGGQGTVSSGTYFPHAERHAR
jgi:hypothetical protein